MGLLLWHRGIVVITNPKLNLTKLELRVCAGSNPAHDMSQVCNGKNLKQGSRLEISPNDFRRSTIKQKKFILIHHHQICSSNFDKIKFGLFQVQKTWPYQFLKFIDQKPQAKISEKTNDQYRNKLPTERRSPSQTD